MMRTPARFSGSPAAIPDGSRIKKALLFHFQIIHSASSVIKTGKDFPGKLTPLRHSADICVLPGRLDFRLPIWYTGYGEQFVPDAAARPDQCIPEWRNPI